nr:15134_t:CDS:2 [Entrophospora candida]
MNEKSVCLEIELNIEQMENAKSVEPEKAFHLTKLLTSNMLYLVDELKKIEGMSAQDLWMKELDVLERHGTNLKC